MAGLSFSAFKLNVDGVTVITDLVAQPNYHYSLMCASSNTYICISTHTELSVRLRAYGWQVTST